MQVTWLPDAVTRPRRLAVGEFDGVHRGHQAVIGDADTVLTFEPHPRAVVAPEKAPRLLTPLDVKADLVSALGVQELVVIPFDAAFSQQTPEAFIDDVLVGRLGATEVRVGADFRFGHRATGDPDLLSACEAFTTVVAQMVEVDGEIVSSTHIRALIETGDVGIAATFLGHPFQLRGVVQHGDKRGRTLGYPTANLVPVPSTVLPANGVYACEARVGDITRPAAVNVGVRPTFQSDRGILVEAFLLDFTGDLYDQELSLSFVRRLRGEERFDSVEALIEQMERDTADTREAVG
jgi:riboflavin kinase / FMN adenylyltransferase